MSLMESNRPDPVHVRALAARRGELPANLADCRPTCPDCYGPGEDPPRRVRRVRLPERDEERPSKDPRYSWLPPV
jgi:hypothetical protein